MISSLENMDSFSSFIYLKKNIHDEKYHGRQTIKRFGKCLVGINQWETSGFFFLFTRLLLLLLLLEMQRENELGQYRRPPGRRTR
jgi:hypothetical protein